MQPTGRVQGGELGDHRQIADIFDAPTPRLPAAFANRQAASSTGAWKGSTVNSSALWRSISHRRVCFAVRLIFTTCGRCFATAEGRASRDPGQAFSVTRLPRFGVSSGRSCVRASARRSAFSW